ELSNSSRALRVRLNMGIQRSKNAKSAECAEHRIAQPSLHHLLVGAFGLHARLTRASIVRRSRMQRRSAASRRRTRSSPIAPSEALTTTERPSTLLGPIATRSTSLGPSPTILQQASP